jgi:hypothetical protein
LNNPTQPRITLAGYRVADLVVSADDDIEPQRSFTPMP